MRALQKKHEEKDFNRFKWPQPCITHTHTGKDTLHLCMVNTFPSVIICVDVLIFGALFMFRLFCVKVNQSHWSALYLSTSRTLVFICFRPLSDIAVLAYSLSGTEKCSLSLSHAVHVFTPDFKIQHLHNLSYHWAILIPAEAFKLPTSQRCCPQQLLGLMEFFFSELFTPWYNFQIRTWLI